MTGNPLSRRDVMRGAVVVGAGMATSGLSLAQAAPALAVDAPTIASCATWGAAAPRGTISSVSANPNKIIVHHTASANVTDYSLAAAYAHAREIQQWHFAEGWVDSGQHFTISRGGHAMEGRRGSLGKLTAGSGAIVGAHTSGQNSTGVGIENQGTYTSATPPASLYNKLTQLCAYICDQYGIRPTQIFGHRDYNATQCPGDVLYARLPQLRTDVAALLNGTTPPAWSTIIDNTSGGFAAGANWATSAYSAERYGENYRYANPEEVSDLATYSATIPAAGTYRIDTWYPGIAGYNTSTPYIIYTASGSQVVRVDQSVGGGAWASLGTYSLAAGSHSVAAVSRWTTTAGYVVADAIRITRV
ncbi:N-acetylmuramoyl-L-alanine amidase [Actinomycetes bacterium KLBMP 9797]